MIKFCRVNKETGEALLVLGLDDENVRRLRAEQPILFEPATQGMPMRVTVDGHEGVLRHIAILWQETPQQLAETVARVAGHPPAAVRAAAAEAGLLKPEDEPHG